MSRNFTPEEILVDQLVINDTQAFEELHHRYCVSLYSYCVGKLNSPTEAKRIVREIFVSLWENRHALPVNFSISIHLYAEVRRKVIESINHKLREEKETSIIEENIIPGFTALQLRKAKQPVKTVFTDRMNIQTGMIHQKEQGHNSLEYYFNSLVLRNLKHAFQRVMHFW